MPDQSYRLLYDIQVQGLDKLDGISANQQKISLESRYSAKELQAFENVLRQTATGGTSYAQALKEISRSTVAADATYKSIAKTLLDNDRAQQKSTQVAEQEAAKRVRIAEQEAKEEQRSANAAFQTNQRIWKQQQQQAAQAAAQQAAQAAQQAVAARQGIQGGLQLTGFGGIGYGAANLLRAGAGIAAIGGAGFAAYEGIQLVKDAAQQARELQNLANEFGITAQQAFKLDAAAKLSGESLGTMGRAAAKLDEAITNPGTSGKKTAEELTKLGVSINQSLGGALEQTLQKLAGIANEGERSTKAIELFGGRLGPVMAEVAGHIKDVGQNLDEDVQKKLLEAQKALAEWGNEWTIVKGQVAAAAIDIGKSIASIWEKAGKPQSSPIPAAAEDANRDRAGQGPLAGKGLFDTPKGPTVPKAPGAPAWATERGDPGPLFKILRDGSKPDLQEELAEKHRQRVDAEEKAYNAARIGGSKQGLAMWGEQVQTLRREEQDLQNRLHPKNPKSGSAVENRYDAEMRRYDAEEYKAKYPTSEYGRIPELQMQLQEELGRNNRRDSGYTPKERNTLNSRARQANNKAVIEAAREQGEKIVKAREQLEKEAERIAIEVDHARDQQNRTDTEDAYRGSNPALGWALYGNLTEGYYEGNRLKAEENRKQRQFTNLGLSAQLRGLQTQSSTATAYRSFQDLNTPNNTYTAQLNLAQKEYDLRSKMAQLEEDANQRDLEQQRAKYDFIEAQQNAELERTQKILEAQKKNQQETGNFLSGLVNAGIDGNVGGFFRQQGRSMLSTIDNNLGQNLPFTLNSAVSLGKTGVLGSQDKPNFFGKLLKGTPFGFDEGAGATSGLQTATGLNTQATIDNTNTLRAIIGATPLPGGSTTATTPNASVGDSTVASGFGSGSFGNLFGGIPGISSPTTAPFVPSYLTNPGDGLPIASGPRLSLPGISSGTSAASTATGISGAIGQLLGGAGTVTSGHALEAILKGSADLGNGTGTALSGLGRVGAAAGLAGTEATGILTALKGFSSGGGRGITQGLAGALGAAAPLSGPLSPFLAAGAGVTSLIASLFPDPRKARQEQEQRTVTHNAFVQPASQDILATYGGAGSSGGFNYGEGGGVRSAAQTSIAPVIHINATSADTFVNWAKQNPDAFSEAMLYGISGSSGNAIVSDLALRSPSAGWS